jgi:hypothetical protein
MLKNVKNGLANHTSHSQAIDCNDNVEKVSDKDIPSCEHIGCDREATEKIELSAGIYGKLLINVCNNCIGIFKQVGGDIHDSF